MLSKLAYNIEMSFQIPDSEKKIAAQASAYFMQVVNKLSLSLDHLEIIYNTFDKFPNTTPEGLEEGRGKFNLFKQEAKKNFEEIKAMAFRAMQTLHYFNTDNQILEILNAFQDEIEELCGKVESFLEIMDDFRSPDFVANLMKAIEEVRTKSESAENLIKDRIVSHIDTHILGKNWLSGTSERLQTKIEDRIPYITQLFNERQKALEGKDQMVQTSKRPQSLNPLDSQRIYYPTDYQPAAPQEGGKLGE